MKLASLLTVTPSAPAVLETFQMTICGNEDKNLEELFTYQRSKMPPSNQAHTQRSAAQRSKRLIRLRTSAYECLASPK
jgi:hypothetical protein